MAGGSDAWANSSIWGEEVLARRPRGLRLVLASARDFLYGRKRSEGSMSCGWSNFYPPTPSWVTEDVTHGDVCLALVFTPASQQRRSSADEACRRCIMRDVGSGGGYLNQPTPKEDGELLQCATHPHKKPLQQTATFVSNSRKEAIAAKVTWLQRKVIETGEFFSRLLQQCIAFFFGEFLLAFIGTTPQMCWKSDKLLISGDISCSSCRWSQAYSII